MSHFKYTCHVKDTLAKPIWCITFHPDPALRLVFASVTCNQIKVYDLLQPHSIELRQAFVDEDVCVGCEHLSDCPQKEEEFYTCAWMQDAEGHQMIAAAGLASVIKIVDCQRYMFYRALVGHGGPVNELAAHPVERHLLLSASDDDSIRLWNIQDGSCVHVFGGDGGHMSKVVSLAWHADGTKFVSGALDNTIRLWSRPGPGASQVQQHPLFATCRAHYNYVDCVRWIGDIVASKSTNNKIVLWEPEGKDAAVVLCELKYQNCEKWFMRFAVNASAGICVVGTTKGSVFVFDLLSSKFDKVELTHHLCKESVLMPAISADAKYVMRVIASFPHILQSDAVGLRRRHYLAMGSCVMSYTAPVA